ncbi:MAG: hypothetical protein DSZ05_07725 [Sulfurospirillum sp.]|nr:MAG: hypothetical protein DSZ05_07725 [Sulfurospirillum sp.]
MRHLLLLPLILFFVSCGYKPTMIYSKEVLGENIYVEVKTSLKDPENTVLIRDALNEAVITRFRSRIVPRQNASSQLVMSLKRVSFLPIQYDKNGYVIAYKTYVDLLTRYKDKAGHSGVITSRGDYDFAIESNSVISDTKRFEAIKHASYKAIEEFISKLSVKGIKNDNQ